jgi:hypothetical protein
MIGESLRFSEELSAQNDLMYTVGQDVEDKGMIVLLTSEAKGDLCGPCSFHIVTLPDRDSLYMFAIDREALLIAYASSMKL